MGVVRAEPASNLDGISRISRISPEPRSAPLANVHPFRTGDVRRLAHALRALSRERKTSLQYHLAIAKCVVDELYGGKLEAFRSEGKHGPSFRKLARDLGDAIKQTTLHRALCAYEVLETTPVYVIPEAACASRASAGVPTLERVSADELERLGVLHLYEVRALDTPLRSELLSRALHGRWSVRRLRREVAARTGAPHRADRADRPAILSLLLSLPELPSTMDMSPLTTLSEREAYLYQHIIEKLQTLAVRAQGALAQRPSAEEPA